MQTILPFKQQFKHGQYHKLQTEIQIVLLERNSLTCWVLFFDLSRKISYF